MLRFKALVVMCLGLLVACGPTESKAPVSGEPSGKTASALAPAAGVSPSSLDFGQQRVGTASAPRSVTVRNSGSSPLTLTSAVLSGPFSLVGAPTLPAMVAPADSLVLTVDFRPVAEVTATGTLTLTTDDPSASNIVVALAGSGGAPALSLSASALALGDQRVGRTSGVLSLILSNTGSAELLITQFLVSNSVFTISSPQPLPTDNTPMRIAPGEQKVVGVSFSPTEPGLAQGKLHILGNASSSAVAVELTGKGVDGQLGLTPGAVSFSTVDVGASGVQQSVVLSNTGGASLTITKITPPGEPSFSLSGLAPGLVLKPGEQWPFTVSFSPARRGYVSTSVIIHGDATFNPDLTLPLSGTGVAPVVEVLPAELAFGRSNLGVATLQSLAIKNVGERELLVSNLAFENVTQGAALDFSLGSPGTLPLVVKPGESSLVQVKFSPTAVGPREARAIVYTNDKAAVVRVQGEGTSPNLELAPAALDFGNVLVGNFSAPRTLKLVNTGTGPLTLFSLTLGGVDAAAFALTSAALPISLPPGASTEVSLSLRTDAERRFSAQLLVGSSDPDAPSVTAPLTGVGVSQVIQFSATGLEFGRQLIHHTSLPRKVRITNAGNVRVVLTSLSVVGQAASRFSPEPLALPLALEPGQQQEVAVTFTPQDEAEVENCALKFTFAELPQSYTVGLGGKGIPTVLAINPSPLDFGTVRPGSGKREQPLTVSNLSSDPIILAMPEVTYQTGEPFTFDTTLVQGRTLEPGMSVIVPVAYQPTGETLSETSLSFGTTVPARPRAVDVPVKGKATNTLLFVDPGSLNFGRVDVSAPELRKEVTLINTSSQSLWVVAKLRDSEGSPFSVVEATALAEPIPPAGRVTFKVSFLPQVQGEAQNELQVWLQGGSSPEAVLPMSGTGYGGSTEQPRGCSCGSTGTGSAGMLVLLALVGLGSRRRRDA